MAFWALIPALAGMASQAAGAEAGAAATVEGAKTQAAISQLGQDYQKRLLDKELAMTEQDRALGYAALPAFQKYLYEREAPGGGLTEMRGQLMGEALSDLRPEVQRTVRDRAMAGEQESAYGRLLDMIRVGQGEAASAGQAYGGQSAALSNLLMQRGARGSEALRSAAEQRQGMSRGIATALGDIPAYAQQQRYLQPRLAEDRYIAAGGEGPYQYRDKY